MAPIRILIGEMPRMLSDILRDVLAAQPDMEVVGSCDAGDLAATVRAQRPDVILAEEGWAALNLPGRELFAGEHRVRVLAIGAGGHEARLLELGQLPVREVSPRGLVEAIREALARERTQAAAGPTSASQP